MEQQQYINGNNRHQRIGYRTCRRYNKHYLYDISGLYEGHNDHGQCITINDLNPIIVCECNHYVHGYTIGWFMEQQ
jgi:hypothetical protein